jgi:hypothetical protein
LEHTINDAGIFEVCGKDLKENSNDCMKARNKVWHQEWWNVKKWRKKKQKKSPRIASMKESEKIEGMIVERGINDGRMSKTKGHLRA